MRAAEVNRRIYDSPGVAEYWCDQQFLGPAEELILTSHQSEIKDQPLLEIGVGGGRITPHLTALTKDYIGIDCSPRMIELVHRKFKQTTFLLCSAERMTQFENQHFNTVVWFGNGLDEVEHEERILILKEIHRVLKKGGILLFSSHNFDWGRLVWMAAFDDFSFSRGITHLARSFPHRLWIYLSGQWVRLSARLNRRCYGIFLYYDDSPLGSTLVYHISSKSQIKQLMNAGFEQVQCFSSGGYALNEHPNADLNGRLDYEIYYVCRKG